MDTVIGRRLPDGTPPRKPGEFAWMPYALWQHRPPFVLGDGEWHIPPGDEDVEEQPAPKVRRLRAA